MSLPSYVTASRYGFKWEWCRHLLSSTCWLTCHSANCTVAQAYSPYLALDASLAAAAVAGVTVQAAVASAFLPWEANGPELCLLARVNAGDAGGSQQGSAALGGQRLKEEAVVHLHPIYVQVLVWDVIQSQQVGLSALHGAIPRQLWKTVSRELGAVDRFNRILKTHHKHMALCGGRIK